MHNTRLLMSPKQAQMLYEAHEWLLQKLQEEGLLAVGILASPLGWPFDAPYHFLFQRINRDNEFPSCLLLWVKGEPRTY